MVPEISLIWTEEGGTYSGDPQLVSLNASYHKEKQYLWLRYGVLNGS